MQDMQVQSLVRELRSHMPRRNLVYESTIISQLQSLTLSLKALQPTLQIPQAGVWHGSSQPLWDASQALHCLPLSTSPHPHTEVELNDRAIQ